MSFHKASIAISESSVWNGFFSFFTPKGENTDKWVKYFSDLFVCFLPHSAAPLLTGYFKGILILQPKHLYRHKNEIKKQKIGFKNKKARQMPGRYGDQG
ncbi:MULTISPECIES: hypothetical protein [unclassified Thalassolituus]|uniref:hypothetical protein n=1 Tax=unclassified Thalassolituus TaxID=2624967 RepID=UPI0025F07127|nr:MULTISPECIES: hypothetical protein [unclassified Thalassolituus]